MKIEPYIAQLLYRYQCVTVPGFGAFLTEIQSARRNEGTNSFFPPKKRISFNANLKNNDGLLANHIALAEKTSYEYAVSAIQYEVFEWKKALEEKQILVLKNIGDLRLNAENNIVFTPSETTNYLTSSFGLSTFVLQWFKKRLGYERKIEVQNEISSLYSRNEAVRSINPYLKYAAVVA